MGSYRLDPRVYRPAAGDMFRLEPKGTYAFDVEVESVAFWTAKVCRVYDNGMRQCVAMPAASVAHFVNDLQGEVVVPQGRDPYVNAVAAGDAEFLGKGDDGLAFRAGPMVVKVSTTVPYQPFNPGHQSPAQAARRMADQQAISAAMRRDGVPGILPSKLVVQGDKAFMVKPYVEVGDLDCDQVASVAQSVEYAHDAGWVFRDSFQVGTLPSDGALYHFDTGKAARSTTHRTRHAYDSQESDDISELRRFFRQHGCKYLTAAEKESPVAAFEDAMLLEPDGLTADEKRAHRRLLQQLKDRVDIYARNFPDALDAAPWVGAAAERDFKDTLARFR